ncbi:MAG: hypothetical protein LBK68_06955 [Candidatus Margulisbacteria bacterium]|nr:hypothetical protein [Candidatus Margulisiibacteriota bacterium]
MTNADNYNDTYSGIATGEPLSAATMTAALNTKEKVANKQVDSTDAAGTLTGSSSDSYYPSSKLVGKNLDTLNTTISTGLSGKQDKIGAGTASDILTKTTTAGTLGTLTKTTSVAAAASASDSKIPTEKAVATVISALGVSGKEDTSNKATSITNSNKNDETKYPTLGAVTAWVADATSAVTTLIDALLPKGTILAMESMAYYNGASSEFRDKWKVCNGTNDTPNLQHKFLRGLQSGDTTISGGVDSVTLAAANLPSHAHTVNDQGHSHNIKIWGRSGDSGSGGSWVGTGDTIHTTETTTTGITVTGGGGSPQTAVSLLPSYYAVIYIMKIN